MNAQRSPWRINEGRVWAVERQILQELIDSEGGAASELLTGFITNTRSEARSSLIVLQTELYIRSNNQLLQMNVAIKSLQARTQQRKHR